MDEAKLMNSFNGKNNLSNIKAGNILGKDFIFDEHSHQVTTGQKLHEHIQKVCVLESGVQLDDPWAVRLGENITF